MTKKKFMLEENEYREFTNKTMIKDKIKIVVITGFVIFALSIVILFKEGIIQALSTAAALFVLYVFIVFIGLLLFAPFFTRRSYIKNKINELNFEYEVLNTGIKQNKMTYLYDEFKKVRESKISYYLYLKSKQVILLPKRIFNNEETNEFKQLLTKKISDVKFKKTNKK